MLSILYHAYRLLSHAVDITAHPQQDREERYLAESADIHDLERRMREVDSGRTNRYAIGSTGIFTR